MCIWCYFAVGSGQRPEGTTGTGAAGYTNRGVDREEASLSSSRKTKMGTGKLGSINTFLREGNHASGFESQETGTVLQQARVYRYVRRLIRTRKNLVTCRHLAVSA